ncbi:MAG: cyclic nucleotide-binding domain-containing protein [Alphaproteobacteria bacterium]|nr:cyclic nucleotide-binding domain-containing protein [Alphaproteobacteria bacterium]
MPGDDVALLSQGSEAERFLTLEILDKIRKLPLFAGLGPGALATLLDGARLRDFDRDTVLFRQGERAEVFYIVMSGRISLLVADNIGRESVIEIAAAGQTFGEEAIFDQRLFPFSARVLEPSRLIRVLVEPFLANFAKDFRLVQRMMASMSSHLRFLVKQIAELKLKTTEQRLGSYLLGQIQEGKMTATIHLPYDKKILASQLGMTPESLSRALAKLKEIGIHSGTGFLRVEDVPRLRALCHESDFNE